MHKEHSKGRDPNDSRQETAVRKQLRSAAEESIAKEVKLNRHDIEGLSLEELNNIIHDLKVHQIELEMQNEELKRIQVELDITKTRYVDLYEMAPGGYLVVSEAGNILEANLTAAVLLGLKRGNLSKQRLVTSVFREDQSDYYFFIKNLFRSMCHAECELRFIKSDGTLMWANVVATAVEEGTELVCRIIISDISKRKDIEQSLFNSEEKYRLLYKSMEQGLAYYEVILDTKGNPIDFLFIDGNDSYCSMLEIPREMCIGKRIKEVRPEIPQNWIDVFGQVAITGKPSHFENNLEMTGKYYSIYIYSPKKNHCAVLVSDISERRKKEEDVRYLSYHDQLTDTYNRRFYEEEIKRLDNTENLPLTIIMGDLNGLKLINDSFGHQIGDKILLAAANAMKKVCGTKGTIARVGGDEFVILLSNTDDSEARNIISQMNSIALMKETPHLEVSISFGCATKTSKNQGVQDIFKEAEDNMYQSKLNESASFKSKTITLIMNALNEKSPRERLHSERVSNICAVIAKSMNLPDSEVQEVQIAGLMHDIGKIGLDEELLSSDGELSSDNWKAITRHSEIGYRILSSSIEFAKIATSVLNHHERWDGQGYPNGLKGEDIPFLARIVSIADAYDAMTTPRTYKKTFSREEAIEEFKRFSGTQFDPDIARVFVEKVLGREWK
jgi:diguanylate cyclase (GGDEF)-like protein/PAS domain S-box-containing protein